MSLHLNGIAHLSLCLHFVNLSFSLSLSLVITVWSSLFVFRSFIRHGSWCHQFHFVIDLGPRVHEGQFTFSSCHRHSTLLYSVRWMIDLSKDVLFLSFSFFSSFLSEKLAFHQCIDCSVTLSRIFFVFFSPILPFTRVLLVSFSRYTWMIHSFIRSLAVCWDSLFFSCITVNRCLWLCVYWIIRCDDYTRSEVLVYLVPASGHWSQLFFSHATQFTCIMKKEKERKKERLFALV